MLEKVNCACLLCQIVNYAAKKFYDIVPHSLFLVTHGQQKSFTYGLTSEVSFPNKQPLQTNFWCQDILSTWHFCQMFSQPLAKTKIILTTQDSIY